MQLSRVHIKEQTVIGTLHGRPVTLIQTHGGLCLIAAHKNGQLITIGAGPVPGVAKFLAEKKEGDIIWAESMVKSDSDKDLVCPLCKQRDTADECMCLYREGYLPTKPIKF